MVRVIVASYAENSREQVSRLLASAGFGVFRCCASGGEVRRAVQESDGGVVVLVGQLRDCTTDSLAWDIREHTHVLFVARPEAHAQCEYPDLFRLTLPCSGHEIVGAVEMLIQLRQRQRSRRTGQDRALVDQAKAYLMKRDGLSEPEAHRRMQKFAMDHGVKMVDVAARLLRSTRLTEE